MASKKGKVKWFDQKKGYGFLQQTSGPDVFVHFFCIEGGTRGSKTLEEGQAVSFEIKESPKGPEAVHVIIEGAAA